MLQPLQRIDSLAVHPQLEIQRRVAGGGCAQPTDVLTGPNRGAAPDRKLEQVAVQRERLVAVVDDDKVAQPLEAAGVRHGAAVHRANGTPFDAENGEGGAIDARAGGTPLRRTSHGPRQGATERADGQGRDHRPADAGDRRLEFLLSHLHLTDELCVQVASLIDFPHQGVLRGDRLCSRGLRSHRLGSSRAERRLADLARRLSGAQLPEARFVLAHPRLITRRNSRDRSGCLTDLSHVGRRQQHPHVSPAAELVELGEAGAQSWPFRIARLLDLLNLDVDVVQRSRGLDAGVVSLSQFLMGDLTCHLEPAELSKQATRLPGQPIGFRVQGRQPITGLPAQGVAGDDAILFLCAQWCANGESRQAHDHEQSRHPERPRSDECDEPLTDDDGGHLFAVIGFAGPTVQRQPSDTLWLRVKGGSMRALGVDLGTRRIGLAVSDPSGTLARPFKALTVTPATALDSLVLEIDRLAAEDDGLAVIVVGVPVRLDGSASEATTQARNVIDLLRTRTRLPVVAEDERLTSHEAEQRLAVREKDWRKRKAQLDAAAAAIFLQDFLDRRSTGQLRTSDEEGRDED